MSCVDVAVPMVIARASEFGKTGTEEVKALRGDAAFFNALRTLWIEAGLKMGLKGKGGKRMTADELANSETIPKVCIVGPAVNGGLPTINQDNCSGISYQFSFTVNGRQA